MNNTYVDMLMRNNIDYSDTENIYENYKKTQYGGNSNKPSGCFLKLLLVKKQEKTYEGSNKNIVSIKDILINRKNTDSDNYI